MCTAGQSIACVGPAGCSGGQACKSDGSGYEACQCGTPADGGGDARVDAAPGDAGDGAVGWKPTALGSGLSLWLEADVGVTLASQHVSKWADQSGNGNDATPTNPSTSATMGTTSGHAVLQFVPATAALLVADAVSLQFPSDFAVELVVDATAGGGGFAYSKVPIGSPNGMQINWGGSSPPVFINNPYILPYSMGGGTVDLTDAKLHVIGVRRTGATCEVRVDGVATAGQTNACSLVLANSSGSPVTLGRSYDLGNGSTENYGEIVAVKGTLSNGDLASLEAYFKAKYGL